MSTGYRDGRKPESHDLVVPVMRDPLLDWTRKLETMLSDGTVLWRYGMKGLMKPRWRLMPRLG